METTDIQIIPANPTPTRPGQIERLYARRKEVADELALLDDAIAALEANPQMAQLLTVVTRAIANRGDW